MENIIENHKYFDTQRDDEKIIMITRRHWIVYLPAFLIGFVVSITVFITYLYTTNTSIFLNNETVKAIIICALSLVFLFSILGVYISWLINYLNFQLVTNENVVDIDQLSLFSRKISELCLEDIQDTTASQKGIVQSVFHYGDVVIQTAGEKPNFVFEKINQPYEVARKIMEIKEEYSNGKSGESSKTPDKGVPEA